MKKSDLKNIEYFSKGKRGVIYTANYKGIKVAIKKKRKNSEAIMRIEHEHRMLKILNKHKIGPTLIGYLKSSKGDEDAFVYEFVEGITFEEAVKTLSKKELLSIFKKILDQCFTLDQLGYQKEEMTRPKKHVIIKGPQVTMLDFERCHLVNQPSNVTQFVQALTLKFMALTLKEKGFNYDTKKLRILAKSYKEHRDKKHLKLIVQELSI